MNHDDQERFKLPDGLDLYYDDDQQQWVLWKPKDPGTITRHRSLVEAFRMAGRPDLALLLEQDLRGER